MSLFFGGFAPDPKTIPVFWSPRGTMLFESHLREKKVRKNQCLTSGPIRTRTRNGFVKKNQQERMPHIRTNPSGSGRSILWQINENGSWCLTSRFAHDPDRSFSSFMGTIFQPILSKKKGKNWQKKTW